MLSAYPKHLTQGASLKNSAWVDLLDPTEPEKSAFQDAFGLQVPVKEQLAEIETEILECRQRGRHEQLGGKQPERGSVG